MLEVETRNLKGPRIFDPSGIPLHEDNQTIVKERIFLDKANPNILRDEITTIDNALTRPWTVKRPYRRIAAKQPIWSEYYCSEDNHHVQIGKENYVISGDGYLLPVRKGQPAPELNISTSDGGETKVPARKWSRSTGPFMMMGGQSCSIARSVPSHWQRR